MANEQWIQKDTSINRDDIIQWFYNIHTGNRVYGKTDGTLSSNIHLHYLDGTNSGLNMDPVTGEVKKDGNVLGVMLSIGILVIEAGVGGALGATDAVVDTAKGLFGPDGKPINITNLIFPPSP